MNEERFERIEIKITDLEDTVQELNRTVYQQQRTIGQLQAVCEALAVQLRELSARREMGPANEKPPHY